MRALQLSRNSSRNLAGRGYYQGTIVRYPAIFPAILRDSSCWCGGQFEIMQEPEAIEAEARSTDEELKRILSELGV